MSSAILKGKRGVILVCAMIIACLAALLALPPVRSAADDLLGIFRVKKFAAVTIIPAEIPPLLGLADVSRLEHFDASVLGTFVPPEEPEIHEVATVAEASALVDFHVRVPQELPQSVAESRKITVIGDTSFSHTFDLENVKSLLDDFGLQDVELPANLDGATVTATIPSFVLMSFGTEDEPLLLAQGESPILEMPTDLDLEGPRAQLLDFYSLYAPQTAAQIRAVEDWENTLIVPVPPGATHRMVTVDDVEGLLIEGIGDQMLPDSYRMAALVWQKEDVLYGLASVLPGEDLLTIADSLK